MLEAAEVCLRHLHHIAKLVNTRECDLVSERPDTDKLVAMYTVIDKNPVTGCYCCEPEA